MVNVGSGRKLDVEEAAEKLSCMMEWRLDFMPVPLTEVPTPSQKSHEPKELHPHPMMEKSIVWLHSV